MTDQHMPTPSCFPPTGTVTFLFTDIEGSTRLAQAHPAKWETARARHHLLLRQAIEANHGYVFQIIGDAFCAAFSKAIDAIHAALQAQHGLQTETWGEIVIRVRMGIHTGEAETDGKDYRGYLTLCHVQRIMAAGHGGQILLSSTVERLLQDQLPDSVSLRDMGEHKLKDLPHPVRIFQVVAVGLQTEFPALKTQDIHRNKLPVQLTEFIGREKELAEVEEALAQNRLVTLIGSGGTGKTRLAIEAGAAQISNSQFLHGIYFVALAPVESIEAIVPTIASALEFSFYDGSEPRQQLIDYLREKSLLLILDNFEHLLAGAELITEILNSAPGVKILATSRARLNVEGEQLFHLTGMDFPNWESPENSIEYSAIKLFLQAARRVRPDFKPTSAEMRYIVRLCRLVEGMPLGILLAACWIEMLSPEEIAKEIEKNLDFLETRQRDLPARQHSIRAVFDYSWKLLTPGERNVFMKASVFRGGFTLAAVKQVTNASLRDLMGLMDKSLLYRDPTGRYSVHELLRQYADEKLLESGQSASIHARHLEFFLQFAEDVEPKLLSAEQHDWLERLDVEHDNLRSALELSLNNGCIDQGMRLANALLWFWHMRSYWSEGIEITRKLLTQSSASPRTLLRAKTLVTQAILLEHFTEQKLQRLLLEESISIAREQGDAGKQTLAMSLGLMGEELLDDNPEMARSTIEEGLRVAESTGQKWLIAFELLSFGIFLISQRDYVAVRENLNESLRLFEIVGDRYRSARVTHLLAMEEVRQHDVASARRRYETLLPFLREQGYRREISQVLNVLGVIAHAEGNYDLAKGYYVESLEIARELGTGIFSPAKNLGCILLYSGDMAGAKSLFSECMEIAQNKGSKAIIGYAIQSYASVAAVENQARRAIVLLAAVRKIQEGAADKTVLSPAGEFDFARTLRLAREQLDETTFSAAWAEGCAMTIEQATQLALDEKL